MIKKNCLNVVTGILLLICSIFILNSVTIRAAMVDEADDYELGETYSGFVNAQKEGTRYYKFIINEKSHVMLDILVQGEKDQYGNLSIGCDLYDINGKVVLRGSDLYYKKNETTGMWKANHFVNLSEGEYYFAIGTSWGGAKNFSFSIKAQKKIDLPKGEITYLKSNKAGQIIVKLKSVENAIGYKIQYSTNYSFKNGTKTISSPNVKKTISGLKKGQRYYVRVCPYTVYEDGEQAFGMNSYVKQVVVKK